MARHPGQSTLIVSHSGALNRLLMSWLAIDPGRHPVFHFDNASITRIFLNGTLLQIRSLNDIVHLQATTEPVDAATHW